MNVVPFFVIFLWKNYIGRIYSIDGTFQRLFPESNNGKRHYVQMFSIFLQAEFLHQLLGSKSFQGEQLPI